MRERAMLFQLRGKRLVPEPVEGPAGLWFLTPGGRPFDRLRNLSPYTRRP